MKLLCIDAGGTSLDLALRAQAYGHEVRVFIRHNKDGSRSEVGDGLINRVPHWEQHMRWADLIFVTDNTFYVHMLDNYIKKGYPIFGPCYDAVQWEQDRELGAEVHDRVGVKNIPMKKFHNYDEAIKYVMQTNKRYVSKPVGDGDKSLSYVAKSPADLVYMLQYWKKKSSYKGDFVLQDFRPGIEMAVGGWFGSGGFSKNFCENWEFKKLMNDDLGVATGEQGTILRYTTESKLADVVLRPVEDMLHGLGYNGYIDVNCIIDEYGTPWPLEWTMRPGWPLFQIQQALHKGDPIGWMLDLINGKDTLKVSKDVACGVVISMPDYPYSRLTKKECSGYPLFNLTLEDAVDNVHLSEVQWGKAPSMCEGEVRLNTPMLVTAGDYVATVTGTGKTVKEASEQAYKTIKKKIEIPNSIMYRTDIGHRLEKQLPELHENEYCPDLEYGKC
jgi:phosphoribosylamine--glycine ligase